MMKRHFFSLLLLCAIVVQAAAQQAVTSFTLINADTDVPIKTLVNGDVINYSALPTRNLNIRANTSPATVGSVVFFLDGVRKVENIAPYSFAGESVSGSTVNYNKINPALAAGQHSISATPYTASNGTGTAGGTHTVSFSVVENSSNTPPNVHAGADKTLTLPANSTTLSGSASDPGGSIASLLWTKQSGGAATMTNTTTATLSLSNLVAGTYVFRLTATDNQGATAFDEATVTVNSGTTPSLAVTSFTLINADNEQDIRTLVNGDVIDYSALPTRNLNIRANTNPATVGSVVFFLDGVRKNENGSPYAYAGDGRSGSTITYNKITPELAAGGHTLTATAYSASNGTGTAGGTHTISFSVTNGGTSNTPPNVNAGADKTLTLPANSTTLTGSASDPGGSIASLLWTKQSGGAATMANTTTATLSLSNLVAGTYVFRLTATDNQGATAFDEATVTVNSSTTPSLAVTSFTLINADTDQDIRTLVNGDVIDYSTLPTTNLNIRANTNPATVGSVVFFLDGVRKNENGSPYAYAGDGMSGSTVNYNKITPAMAAGAHTLTATAYSSSNGTGTAGGTHTVNFTVTGSGSTNTPPTANAGADKALTLPANSTTLNGSASDPGGNIASYLWTKQSGPSATLSNTTSATLSVSNMVAGTYVFRLTVTDNQGATDYDEATVTVYPENTGGGGNCAIYNEQNGLVVIEIESQPVTADWTLRTAVAGYTGQGYYEWRHGNTNTSAISAGTGILTYTVQINNPGRYRLQVRSAAPQRTDFNDVWIKFPEGNAYGIRSGSTLNLNANWFKMYHNTSNNSWSWNTKTKDHDPHDIYVDFNTPGIYKVQFSGRSNQFKIDRFVLYNTLVSTADANNSGNPQSACAGGSKMDAAEESGSAALVNLYPNPSSGHVTFEMQATQTGEASIRIYDTKGALVATVFDGVMQAGELKREVFDGRSLAKGIYIVRMVAADSVVTKQLVIQ